MMYSLHDIHGLHNVHGLLDVHSLYDALCSRLFLSHMVTPGTSVTEGNAFSLVGEN